MTQIETTSMSSKGQITIPLRIRKAFKIGAGQKFLFTECREGILLTPVDVTVRDKTASPAWKAGLKQAQADVEAGRVKRFKSEKEFLEFLEKESSASRSR